MLSLFSGQRHYVILEFLPPMWLYYAEVHHLVPVFRFKQELLIIICLNIPKLDGANMTEIEKFKNSK